MPASDRHFNRVWSGDYIWVTDMLVLERMRNVTDNPVSDTWLAPGRPCLHADKYPARVFHSRNKTCLPPGFEVVVHRGLFCCCRPELLVPGPRGALGLLNNPLAQERSHLVPPGPTYNASSEATAKRPFPTRKGQESKRKERYARRHR